MLSNLEETWGPSAGLGQGTEGGSVSEQSKAGSVCTCRAGGLSGRSGGLGGWGGQCPGTEQRWDRAGHGQGDSGASGQRPAHKCALRAGGEDSGEAWSQK